LAQALRNDNPYYRPGELFDEEGLRPEHFEPFRFVDLYQNQMMQTPARAIEAHQRAETLLLEHLNAEQAEQWRNDNSFDVVAQSGSTYKVNAQAGSVTNYEEKRWYCLQADDEEIPSPDLALAHKLWLEADEEGFLRKANCFPLNLEPEHAVGPFWHILTDNTVPVDGARAHLEQRLEDAQRDYEQERMELEERYRRTVVGIHEEFARDRAVGLGQVNTGPCDIVFSDCHAGLGS
jgi:hypothetical protein